MNSYHENLQTSIASILANLQLQQENLQERRGAAFMSWRYAQEALNNAKEKLAGENKKADAQGAIKQQATLANIIAATLSGAANQQKSDSTQSVTNAAINGANVQAALNVIVRLASDIGSIFSILKAADFDTEIYTQGKTALDLISKTAYDAEKLSQNAMEASASVATISSGTVADEANSTATEIANLLQTLSADYDTMAAAVNTATMALGGAAVSEKQVSFALDIVHARWAAANAAYQFTNDQLNLNVAVKINQETGFFTVCFTPYQSPFAAKQTGTKTPPGAGQYPVKSYNVMLVKESKEAVFSIANAENLLLTPQQFITVSSNGGSKELSVNISATQLHDSDGDPMASGENYVVFVLAEMMDEYKKILNNFDDYLSAPSAVFSLNGQATAGKILHKRTSVHQANNSLSPIKPHGITEEKKAELDRLTQTVLEAQNEFERLQTEVNSLSVKSVNFQADLTLADSDRARTLNNQNSLKQVLQDALSVMNNATIVLTETKAVNARCKIVAVDIKKLNDKLIFVAELINKLSNAIIRKKALNPLISDDLVSRITTAGTDASNAVALTLTALRSAFTATTQTEAVSTLTYKQAKGLYAALTDKKTGLKHLIDNAQKQAVIVYDNAYKIDIDGTGQLNSANEKLSRAQINLQSLQSGLAAANAAALAL